MATSGCGDAPSQAPQSLSHRLWSRYEPMAACILHHPFVTGLGTGRLDEATFKSYVGQDAFFLRSFAKAYAYALTKSESQEHIENFSSLIAAVVEELKLHASLSSSLGIDLSSTRPNRACSDYTSFLLDIAQRPTSSVALILASMAPCMRLYAFLGQALKARLGTQAGGEKYREWVESYSSPEFEQAASLVEGLLDQCHHAGSPQQPGAITSTSKDREDEEEEIFDAYARAMELELAFFDAWGGGEGGVKPRAVVVDFDGTCTVEDTTPLLAELAALSCPAPQKARETWAGLTDHYLTAFSSLLSSVTSSTDPRALLDAFAAVDMDSLEAVAHSKVLGGIKKGSVPGLINPYCRSALRLASSSKAGPFLHFLSINWCDEIITAALQLDSTQLTANCLEYDASTGLSTGRVLVTVNGAQGKVEHLRRLLSQPAASGAGPSVYIGDSLTDLLALLEADIGIVIGRSSSLTQVAKMMEVEMRPLLAYQPMAKPGQTEAGKRVLYRAESWMEVGAFLLGANDMARAFNEAAAGEA